MTLYFDDVQPGQQLATLTRVRFRPAHIMRWSAAVENWHRIHYDQTVRQGARQAPRRPDQRIVEAARPGATREGWARPRRLAVEDPVPLQADGRRLGHAERERRGDRETRRRTGSASWRARIALLNQRDEVRPPGFGSACCRSEAGARCPTRSCRSPPTQSSPLRPTDADDARRLSALRRPRTSATGRRSRSTTTR